MAQPAAVFTCQVVVLLTVVVRQGHQLPEQQGVLEHPLHGLDEVGLQRGRVLLGGVPGIQEGLEGVVRFGCKHMDGIPLAQRDGALLLHSVSMQLQVRHVYSPNATE